MTILPITSTLIDAPLLRVSLQPHAENGLHKPSQVMVDKTMTVTVKGDRIGPAIGRIDADTLLEVERCLAVLAGITKQHRPHRSRAGPVRACA